APRLMIWCGVPAGTQVASFTPSSYCSSPMTTTAWPSRISADSSTLCVCRGHSVPEPNVVMPVVTELLATLHVPMSGSVATPLPRSTRSMSVARRTPGAVRGATVMVSPTSGRFLGCVRCHEILIQFDAQAGCIGHGIEPIDETLGGRHQGLAPCDVAE